MKCRSFLHEFGRKARLLADSEGKPKDQSQVIQGDDLIEEVEIDAHVVDELLSEEDPDFLKSLKEVETEKNLTLQQSDEASDGHLLAKVTSTLIKIKSGILEFRTLGKDKVISGFKSFSQKIVFMLKSLGRWWQKLSLQLKLSFFGLIFGAGLLVFYGFSLYKGSVLPQKFNLFLTQLDSKANRVIEISESEPYESFYENTRIVRNLFHIPKVVVNLKKSANSGPNPMGAFEFYLESFAPEVLIEVKERETEFRDLIYRTIEEQTFDLVESAEGKQYLTDQLTQEINRKLKTGRLKRVFIKTAIIKP